MRRRKNQLVHPRPDDRVTSEGPGLTLKVVEKSLPSGPAASAVVAIEPFVTGQVEVYVPAEENGALITINESRHGISMMDYERWSWRRKRIAVG